MKVAWAVPCFFNCFLLSCSSCFGMMGELEKIKSGSGWLNTSFVDDVVVDGDLNVEGCFFEKNLSVGGSFAVLHASQCDGMLKIQPQGSNKNIILTIGNFSWVGVVEINGSAEVTISDSEVTSLVIKDKEKRRSTIYLKDGAVIKGNIVLENGRGVVYATEDVEIEGDIKGAMLLPWDGKKIVDLDKIK